MREGYSCGAAPPGLHPRTPAGAPGRAARGEAAAG
jgi:hypothetical protein